MKMFAVKNFERFQHYRDRSPPWIKFYNELLEDYEFGALPDIQKSHLVLIWLLASRSENKVPWDADWVARKISATDPVDLDALADAGFIVEWSPEDARGKREDWPSRYVSKEVRAVVLDRDGNKCTACGATERLEIDHVIPISQGGTGTIDNLQVLCVSCNRRKRATQMRSNGSADATHQRSLERETESETDKIPIASAIGATAATSPRVPREDPPSRPALDLKAGVFNAGKAFLAANGVPESRAGPVLGRWRRDHGDAAIIDALAAAEGQAVSDPIPWIEARLKAKHGSGTGTNRKAGTGFDAVVAAGAAALGKG